MSFMAANYAAFTLFLLIVAGTAFLAASLYIRTYAPIPDPEGLLREAAAGGEEKFPRLNVRAYLGAGAGAQLYDGSGELLGQAGETGDILSREVLESLPAYDADSRLLSAELPKGEARRLITQMSYGGDGELFISGYALLDEDLQKIGGDLFAENARFTEAELRYLTGLDPEGRRIYSQKFRDSQGRERQLVFFMPQRRMEDYARAYDSLDRAKWLFLPAYAAAAFLCIERFGKKAGRLLAPLNTAIQNYSQGLPSGLAGYEGPREFEELAENFVEMEERLRRSEEERKRLDEEKRRLLADISHDLKTPLTVIQGYADALREGMVPEGEQEEYLRVISQRTRRVNELLLSFHEYSKLDHPQVPVRRKREDLCQAVREYIAGRCGEIELAGFGLQADIPEEPVFCELDGALLCRALENIINNALKYNPPGTCLFVEVAGDGKKALVRIGDNGIGISRELREKLFLPFATGDSARGGGHGSGLGLAISRRIAELHGGELYVADPPRTGRVTEFVFAFPEEE